MIVTKKGSMVYLDGEGKDVIISGGIVGKHKGKKPILTIQHFNLYGDALKCWVVYRQMPNGKWQQCVAGTRKTARLAAKQCKPLKTKITHCYLVPVLGGMK